MYLFRLTYYSRNAIKTLNKPVAAEIKNIVEQSTRNNDSMGITGGLVFNGHYFAQVLEGDRKAVTKTFIRIANDERHTDHVIMSADPIDERTHLEWSIGFAGHSDDIDPLYVRYGLTVGFNPAKMTAASLNRFIIDVTDKNGSARAGSSRDDFTPQARRIMA